MLDKLLIGSQVKFFSRGVNSAERRAEGYHIQAGELLQEQAALKSGVDSLDLGLVPEERLIAVEAYLQDA